MTITLAAPGRTRINSIDILRGIVMVVMALDHVRDYFHKEALTDDPLNLDTTTPWLFFTRFITHFCAPTFVFLAGTSAFLMGQRKSKKELSNFLLSRGIWLVLVEIVIVTLGWSFNPLYNVLLLQVIWAIGISMIILGLLVRLPFQVILVFGLLVVFGHNLLDYPEAAQKNNVNVFWKFAHNARFYFLPYAENKNSGILVAYAFLPWTGLMALGYCLGAWYKSTVPGEVRRRRLIMLGVGLLLLFVLLRFINAYGDPFPWHSHPRGPLYSFFSFMNVNKYPPSLLFMCVTIGTSLIFLALLEKMRAGWTSFFMTYGRVPFFYYILHLYLIHILCVIAFFASGYGSSQIVSPQSLFLFRPPTFGFNLWVVYGVWILVILLLYPFCKRYDVYKSSHRKWWLSYL